MPAKAQDPASPEVSGDDGAASLPATICCVPKPEQSVNITPVPDAAGIQPTGAISRKHGASSAAARPKLKAMLAV